MYRRVETKPVDKSLNKEQCIELFCYAEVPIPKLQFQKNHAQNPKITGVHPTSKRERVDPLFIQHRRRRKIDLSANDSGERLERGGRGRQLIFVNYHMVCAAFRVSIASFDQRERVKALAYLEQEPQYPYMVPHLLASRSPQLPRFRTERRWWSSREASRSGSGMVRAESTRYLELQELLLCP